MAALIAFAAGGRAQNLFEADSWSGRVNKFSPNGTQSVFAEGLSIAWGPFGLVFNSSGNLFVSDYTGGKIYQYTPEGARSAFVEGLSSPTALAIDSGGNLFVASARYTGVEAEGSVIKITPEGGQSVFAAGFWFPSGLAFDRTGNLFVADGQGGGNGTGSIIKIAPDGTQSTFATNGSSSELYLPGQIAFDSAGNLFATTEDGGTIAKITPEGVLTTFASGLSIPVGIAFNSAGDLFVSTTAGASGAGNTKGNIYRFAPDGTKTTFASGLSTPIGLAFQPVLPPLTITLASPNTVLVSWPSEGNTALLQNPMPGAGNWVLNTNTISVVNGTNQVIVDSVTSGAMYFQLIRQ